MPGCAPLEPRSLAVYHPADTDPAPMPQEHTHYDGERQPLLSGLARSKPFYRPRPLWLVPFAITAAIVRGMTVAPRIEVYTHLSCNVAPHHRYNHTTFSLLRAHVFDSALSHDVSNNRTTIFLPQPTPILGPDGDRQDEETDPRILPTKRCLSDPVVQSRAARLQAIMTITVGGLSALTTGWWGHFGERFGRTRVLAIATLGLFLSDLLFILVSTPHSSLAAHGHKLLILAPIFEGLLGGWSSLQCATSAYLSDCTSSGSRSQIFSRFTGIFHLGTMFGPFFSSFLIRNPVLGVSPRSVTEVFWVAVACSFVNIVLVLFLFPESLSVEQRHATRSSPDTHSKGKSRTPMQDIEESAAIDDVSEPRPSGKIIDCFFTPLAVFLPVVVDDRGRRRRDWSLTFLACALFMLMLSVSVSHVKYLYAGHVYGWGAEQLGYYISFLGGARVLNLLVILPFIISTFKPSSQNSNAKPKANLAMSKKAITRARLTREIDFDLGLAWFSLLIDFVSQFLLVSSSPNSKHKSRSNDAGSQTKFVFLSGLGTLGTGSLPAIQSLALCLAQARAFSQAGDDPRSINGDEIDTSRLLSALTVLQAVSQMILGPLLFGVIYSETVASFPKAIFVTTAAILLVAMIFVSLAKPDQVPIKGKRRVKRWEQEEAERGRSRVRKDLRQGSTKLAPSSVLHAPVRANVGRNNIMPVVGPSTSIS